MSENVPEKAVKTKSCLKKGNPSFTHVSGGDERAFRFKADPKSEGSDPLSQSDQMAAWKDQKRKYRRPLTGSLMMSINWHPWESRPDQGASREVGRWVRPAGRTEAPSRGTGAQPVFQALAATRSSPETHWRLDKFDAADSAPPPVAGAPPTSSARRGRPAALYTKGDKDDLEQPFRRPPT